VYDGTSAITPGNVTINASALAGSSTGPNDGKFIGSENVTLEVDTAGAFTSKDVVAGNQNTTTTVKLATGNAVNDNYSLRSQPVLTGAITAKDVTIATGSVQTKIYDGTTLASVTAGNLTGLVSGEQLGATTALGFFDTKDVLTATTVATVYTLADGANGELASNYNLLNPTENIGATIIAKDVTLAPGIAPSKVYDGNTSASVTLGVLTGEVTGETLGTTTVVGTFNSKDVLAANTVTANYTLNDGLNGELASNYNLLNPTEAISSSITAKALTMTGSTAPTKVYDGNTTAGVIVGTLTGEVSGETLGLTTAIGTFNSKDVLAANTVTAIYTLVDGASGELASNYSLANDSLASTITAKALTMTGSAATSKVYDGNRTASVTLGSLSGEVSGETLGTPTVVGTFNSKDVLAANTVTAIYTLVDGASGELASNYSLANDSLASTITAKALTMTGSTAGTKVYDGNTTASVTVGSLSGEVSGETLGQTTVVGTFNSKDVLAANTVTAVYTLVDGANGELASNYSLVNDSLASRITARALTMTGSTALAKVYDGNTTAGV
ncbi:MAG: hypothetical protein EBT70_15650, partial [Betaproteobacteria bacterium]|nr:hypothetical protein [Betaproteobacteria bacterium]